MVVILSSVVNWRIFVLTASFTISLYTKKCASAIPAIPSDAAAILVILGGVPTATGGYTPGDVNMDGRTRANLSAGGITDAHGFEKSDYFKVHAE